jgi:hypothetical protein
VESIRQNRGSDKIDYTEIDLPNYAIRGNNRVSYLASCRMIVARGLLNSFKL